MQDFKDEGIMPIPVDFVSLHAGFDTLEESLYHNKACFHKNCKLLFNSQSFEREKCKRDKRLGSPTYESAQCQTPEATNATRSGGNYFL